MILVATKAKNQKAMEEDPGSGPLLEAIKQSFIIEADEAEN